MTRLLCASMGHQNSVLQRRSMRVKCSAGSGASSQFKRTLIASRSLNLPCLKTACRKEMRDTRVRSSQSDISVQAGDGGSGGNKDVGGEGGNGGNGSDNNGSPGPDPAVAALLLSANRSIESFPADFRIGLAAGKVTLDLLQRYLQLERAFFLGWLMQFAGFRERLLGDPGFLVKVAIECGIGICTKLSAEYAKRHDTFYNELDFVAANVMMAIIADFMLVWLPAPTLSYAARTSTLPIPFAKFFASCPDNAFQKVPPGMEPFTVAQRFGAVIRNGTKLLGVGFCASLIGVATTNILIGIRQMVDPTFVPLNPTQDILATSAAYGTYMATSSNLRYQIVAGIIEERGIETWFKGNSNLCHSLSLIIRTLNTFVGSLLWVDFIRLLGMQKSGGGH